MMNFILDIPMSFFKYLLCWYDQPPAATTATVATAKTAFFHARKSNHSSLIITSPKECFYHFYSFYKAESLLSYSLGQRPGYRNIFILSLQALKGRNNVEGRSFRALLHIVTITCTYFIVEFYILKFRI